MSDVVAAAASATAAAIMRSIEIQGGDVQRVVARSSSPAPASLRGRRSSSVDGGLAFAPLSSLIGGLSRRSLSYDQIPHPPLSLSVLKLDGSCFDLEVPMTATIAELKLAVESVFSHFPQKGPGKISWLHVWGQFCLCYSGQKLLTETDYIRDYGIQDGDQLHFVRHNSISYNLIKKHSRKPSTWKPQNISNEGEERGLCLDDDDQFDDLENPTYQYYEEESEDLHQSNNDCQLTDIWKGWFTYTRIPTKRKNNFEGWSSPSGFVHAFISSIWNLLRIYSEKWRT